MNNPVPIVQLSLNPERLVAIIDEAVLATNEIVNFHFNALANANLAQPAEGGGRFQIRGAEIDSEKRRALHESWILAKAFQEMLRAVRHSLEEAYVFVSLLNKKHRVKSNATLSDLLEPIKRKAAGLKFPDLFEAVNNALEPKIEFSAAYISLQIARNCLEHRGGIVSKIEVHGEEEFKISIPRMKIFYLRNGEEIELQPSQAVDPGDDRKEVDVLMKIEIKKRSFKLVDGI